MSINIKIWSIGVQFIGSSLVYHTRQRESAIGAQTEIRAKESPPLAHKQEYAPKRVRRWRTNRNTRQRESAIGAQTEIRANERAPLGRKRKYSRAPNQSRRVS